MCGASKRDLLSTVNVCRYAIINKKLSVHVLNPKSMPRQQLLGNMDLDTREWTDGVMTANARKVPPLPPTCIFFLSWMPLAYPWGIEVE